MEQAYKLAELVVPPYAGRLRWLVGIGGALIVLYGARMLVAGASGTALLTWGAYQEAHVRDGGWWRVVSYATVYTDVRQLGIDVLALVLFSAAITRLQSFALAFAALRFGLFAALLGFIFGVEAQQVVPTTSGPLYALLGALGVCLFVYRRRVAMATGKDFAAGLLLSGLAAWYLGVPWIGDSVLSAYPSAAWIALASGGVAALIAIGVEQIKQRKAYS